MQMKDDQIPNSTIPFRISKSKLTDIKEIPVIAGEIVRVQTIALKLSRMKNLFR